MNEQRTQLLFDHFADQCDKSMFQFSMGDTSCQTSLTMLANIIAHGVAHLSLDNPLYGNNCLTIIENMQKNHADWMRPHDAVSYTLQALGAVLERSQVACKHVFDKESE